MKTPYDLQRENEALCSQLLEEKANTSALMRQVIDAETERNHARQDLEDTTAGYQQVLKSLKEQLDVTSIEFESLKEAHDALAYAYTELTTILELQERAS